VSWFFLIQQSFLYNQWFDTLVHFQTNVERKSIHFTRPWFNIILQINLFSIYYIARIWHLHIYICIRFLWCLWMVNQEPLTARNIICSTESVITISNFEKETLFENIKISNSLLWYVCIVCNHIYYSNTLMCSMSLDDRK